MIPMCTTKLRPILSVVACWTFSVAWATNAYISQVKPETCGHANGELVAGLQGGVIYNPLTYAWSNGATTPTITGLAAGSYSVTVTDAQGTAYMASITLENVSNLPIAGMVSPSFTGMLEDLGYTGLACPGTCNGAVSFPMVELGGTPPFNVTFDASANYLGVNMYGHPMYGGFCGGDVVNYTLYDAYGCSGGGMFLVMEAGQDWAPFATSTGACVDAEIGRITLGPSIQGSHQELTLYYGGEPIGPPVELYEPISYTFEDLAPGMYELIAVPDWSQCATSQYIVVEDLGPGCAQVTGLSWYDADGDCIHDMDEVGIPGSALLIEPGPHYAITGADGTFTYSLPLGSHTLSQTDPYLVPYCPATMPVAFTISGSQVDIQLANNSTAPLDLRAHISNGWARPGFTHNIHGSVFNDTPRPTGTVEVTLNIDPALVIENVEPPATTTAGNMLTWQLPDLDYFGTAHFLVETTVPSSTPLGTILNSSIMVSSANSETDLSNNTDGAAEMVVGSYDPNDKTAVTSSRSSGSLYYIDQDNWIDYTIRFQNTGTAGAFFVTVTDTLPLELDMTSFQMAVSSHAHTYTFKPGRVVEWFFDDINLPDSATNEAESHGLVKFRIKPAQPLLPGTVIENTANIFFDFNEPVITEPSMLVAEFSTGLGVPSVADLMLVPNPATGAVRISVREGTIRSLRIIGGDGRQALSLNVNAPTAEMDASSLAAGTYAVLAQMADGTMRTHRLSVTGQ